MKPEDITKMFDIVQKDFTVRYVKAKKEFEEMVNRYPALTNKMFELWELCSTDFYGAFHTVTCGGELDMLEGVEGFISFVGNFFDDATYKLSYQLSDIVKDMVDRRCEFLKQEPKYPSPEEDMRGWSVQYANDDEHSLTEAELVEFIDKLIVYELEYRELVVKHVGGNWKDKTIPQAWRDRKFSIKDVKNS